MPRIICTSDTSIHFNIVMVSAVLALHAIHTDTKKEGVVFWTHAQMQIDGVVFRRSSQMQSWGAKLFFSYYQYGPVIDSVRHVTPGIKSLAQTHIHIYI